MNNQFFSLKFSSALPENEIFDIQLSVNDTISCCHWIERIPDDKTLTCELKYKCLDCDYFSSTDTDMEAHIGKNTSPRKIQTPR